jgi:hypothetical protein
MAAQGKNRKPTTTYFVATRFRYVLVDATDEAGARELARELIYELYAEQRARSRDFPENREIHTVRPATENEIELSRWDHEMRTKHTT